MNFPQQNPFAKKLILFVIPLSNIVYALILYMFFFVQEESPLLQGDGSFTWIQEKADLICVLLVIASLFFSVLLWKIMNVLPQQSKSLKNEFTRTIMKMAIFGQGSIINSMFVFLVGFKTVYLLPFLIYTIIQYSFFPKEK